MISVSGKVIIVTGGAQGIGRAYAQTLAKGGAKVVLADISAKVDGTAREIQPDGECMGLRIDVSNEEDTKRMAEEAVKEYGKIDVLVNNAAIFEGLFKGPFSEITTQEWDRVMNVNLKGAFLCSKAVFPQMKLQNKGKIINIASGTFLTGVPYFLHYVSSKGGIIGMTRALARELGQYNITVNCIAPGYTATEASARLDPDPEYMKVIVARRSIKRIQVPEDLTGTMFYLCSDASDFVTGQTIAVNGGDNMH